MGPPIVALSAGEASGDKLAATLARELRQLRPDVSFFGIGGENMAAAGVELVADYRPLAVMGYWDVLSSMPGILSARRRLLRRMQQTPPTLFVGVDAPDFNLSVARWARLAGVKTAQYVAPSVWMWRQRRLLFIRRAVDAVWCLLPFEKQSCASAGVSATFVGHPAAAWRWPAKAAARRRLQVGDDEELIALLPGTRRAELARHLSLFAAVVALMRAPKRRFVAAAADADAAARMRERMPGVDVVAFDDALSAADAAIVKSGTATLEAALAGAPMVIVYRLSAAAHWAARWRKFSLPYFGLPNILLRRFAAPELLLREATPARLAVETERLLADKEARRRMRKAFADIRVMLAHPEKTAAAAAAAMLPPAKTDKAC